MKDFLIRSDVNSTGKAAQIFASRQTRRIEIANWANRFTKDELQPLQQWVDAYLNESDEILTVVLENAWSSFPFVPQEQMKFDQIYTYYENTVYSPIAEILNRLPLFNLHITPTNVHTAPKIITDIAFGTIQIAGNSFTSLHIETYQPFFAWLEKYLNIPGQPIRLEFWFDYFNSSSSKSILEICDVFALYNQKYKGQVNAFWYYQKHDVDMYNEGKEMKEDSGLPIKLIGLDQKKWKTMYSNI